MLHSRRRNDIFQHICQHSKSQAIALDHNKIHDQDQTKLKQKISWNTRRTTEPVLFEKIRNLLILKPDIQIRSRKDHSIDCFMGGQQLEYGIGMRNSLKFSSISIVKIYQFRLLILELVFWNFPTEFQ